MDILDPMNELLNRTIRAAYCSEDNRYLKFETDRGTLVFTARFDGAADIANIRGKAIRTMLVWADADATTYTFGPKGGPRADVVVAGPDPVLATAPDNTVWEGIA